MKTVLVAEDEPAILEMLAAVLGDEGHRVVVAADGLAALEVLAREVPDLVLTDAMMPRLDGLGLVRRMREDPRTAGIPVVVLSAVLRGAPAGVPGVAFLAKPFDLGGLLGVVAAALAGGAP
jgi:CheY-like chemotaxis protein